MFQKLTKKILLSLCIALLFVQAPMATKAKTSEHTEAVQSTEVSKTQNASKTTTPVKYTWKGKKLSSSFFVFMVFTNMKKSITIVSQIFS